MALTANLPPSHSTEASETAKVPLPGSPRLPLSSLLYPKITQVPSSYETSPPFSTSLSADERLRSPPESPLSSQPEWPPSPTSPTTTPFIVTSPAPEPTSPTSPFPADLPHRPQPVHTGNFISRLFKRAPAHPDDVELGTLPQRRMQTTPVLIMEEDQRRRSERLFRIKIAGVVLVIIGFWGLVGMEVWRRQRRE